MNKIHYTYAQNDHTGAREAILPWQQEPHDVSSQSNDEQGSARDSSDLEGQHDDGSDEVANAV